MAYEKKTKEEWDQIARTKSLEKTVQNVELIRDAVAAAKIGGSDANTALLTVLISELMKLNDQIFWIQKAMKPKTYAANDDIKF